MKKSEILITALILIFISVSPIYSDNDNIYCHFTLLEGDVYVFRANQDEAIRAVVNYPLIPGDVIYTNKSGKCEIQFNNGTIMRLDDHTELHISAVLSPVLTTNHKMTTLHLKKGRLFSMNQVYREELFQIITPHVAIKLSSRSTNFITVDPEGDTLIQVRKGSAQILFDEAGREVKQKQLKSGRTYRINSNQGMESETGTPETEFTLWNRKINKNFKNLHYGKSHVPSVVYRRSPGIVHFAEKFSTRFGNWEYNELFGYVWKPADFVFHGRRPFFDANYVKINGELILVPNQAWGWAPAHLGTWFWSKTDGWIWIPGDAFSGGICSTGLVKYPGNWLWASLGPYFTDPVFPNLILQDFYWSYYYSPYYWIDRIYGSFELYRLYRNQGAKAWRVRYAQLYNRKAPGRKPVLKNIPEKIRNIIDRFNRVPVSKIETYLVANRMKPSIPRDIVPVRILNNRIRQSKLPISVNSKLQLHRERLTNQKDQIAITRIDWNPDSKWAKRKGFKIYYSTRNNAVSCPKLKLTSRQLTRFEKAMLKRSSRSMRSPAGFGVISAGSCPGSTQTSTTASNTKSPGSRPGNSNNKNK